jgi:hypothetical protein
MAAAIFICKMIYTFSQTLRVKGAPNEWVLIMRNGVVQKAGIGLSTYRGLNDAVAYFPARINKFVMNSSLVSKEMQDIKIEAIVSWSIYREDKGPQNAYK